MPTDKVKIIRTSTIPTSLNIFCRGLLKELQCRHGYEVIALSSSGDELKEIADREVVKTIAVDMRRKISIINDIISLSKLIKVFKKERPTIVHSITPKAGLLCMLAAWICHVPIRIHTFTGLIFPTTKGVKKQILMLTDRITCACTTHIIPEGEGVKQDLTYYHITRKPLNVLGNGNVRGIDLDYYRRSEEVILEAEKLKDNSKFTFIYIGRIVKDKGINELVEAFDRINSEYQNIRLLLVGRFEDKHNSISQTAMQIISDNDNIKIVGHQDDIRPWLVASDVLVHPSYREGFPNVVIEAGAMGLPAIVTDINGSREIIKDGVNGSIIPSHDIDALYNAIRKFISEKETVKSMADNAREMIASRYEQSYVRKCLTDFYTSTLQIAGRYV